VGGIGIDMSKSFIKKILGKIRIDGECWIWTGQIRFGYPRQKYSKRKKILVHRFLYNFFHNDLSKHLIVHHICKNKICVNPIHLKAMTRSEQGKLNKPQPLRSSDLMENSHGV